MKQNVVLKPKTPTLQDESKTIKGHSASAGCREEPQLGFLGTRSFEGDGISWPNTNTRLNLETTSMENAVDLCSSDGDNDSRVHKRSKSVLESGRVRRTSGRVRQAPAAFVAGPASPTPDATCLSHNPAPASASPKPSSKPHAKPPAELEQPSQVPLMPSNTLSYWSVFAPPQAPGPLTLGLKIEKIASFNGVHLVLASGSVTDFCGDVIVNAANTGGISGGGVDKAINAAGGSELKQARESLPTHPNGARIAVGGAVRTISGDLSKQGCNCIVHAVGPKFTQKNKDDERLLESAYKSALEQAHKVRRICTCPWCERWLSCRWAMHTLSLSRY